MASASYSTRTTCRACGSPDLTELFSLGDQFVNDFPPTASEFGAAGERIHLTVPIVLDLCRNCTLVQARHSPPPDLLYRRHYHYKSGTTDTMRKALADVVDAATRAVDLKSGDVVLDIGSNDGTLLRCYPDNLRRVGVEPAENLTKPENYEVCGLLCVRGFWSKYVTEMLQIQSIRPRIVTACGMLYDLEDPNQFIADVAEVLHPEGVFVSQLMCLRQMLRQNDVGNLAHEHLEFYTLRSLLRLFGKHGLEIYDVEENDVNGGSYRLFARLGNKAASAQAVIKALHAERRAGLGDDVDGMKVRLESWFLDQQERKELLVPFLRREVAAGKRVWVYGASTKGNTLLQWWGLDGTVIEAAADRDPAKRGKHTVNGIPIVEEANFRANSPDYALVLPYAFLPEFIEREKGWMRGGGRFVVPLPEPRVVYLNAHGAVVEVLL